MSEVPYASSVDSLMYTMVYTRPDIAQVVGVVSRHMSNTRKEHWRAVKWIVRYLKGIQIWHYAIMARMFVYTKM